MTPAPRLAICTGLLLLAPAIFAQSSNDADRAIEIRAALRPLQVVVGQWRGNTFRENVVHKVNWAWDHRSDPQVPALVMTASKNPFFKTARLSFDPAEETYLLAIEEPSGEKRELAGTFVEDPENVVGDDGRTLQRTFEILFEQTAPKTGDQWKLVFNQQENNRFLMELSKRRGRAAFRRMDTVSNQRQGTSFAISDEGYGEKTCIISGGLGTIPVSHGGKTYYVCCSGCQKAFVAEPEKWIAAAKKRGGEGSGETREAGEE